MKKKMNRYNRLFALAAVLCVASVLIATEVTGPNQVRLRAIMPVADSFLVEPSENSEQINLIEAQGQSLNVGTYTLTSNRTKAKYTLNILPGETGSDGSFKFTSEDATIDSAAGKVGYDISVVPTTEKGSVVTNAGTAVSKDLGVRDESATNGIVHETGVIIANIPNFDTSSVPTGWYSSVIQFQVVID